MTPNLPQLEDELKYLGYRVPQIVMRTWVRKTQQRRVARWCAVQLNPLLARHSGRPPSLPFSLERFAVKRKGGW